MPGPPRPRDRFGRPLPLGAPGELGDRREPEEAVSGPDQAFAEAVRLFDAQRFFEAHEFLEYVWKAPQTAAEDRDFWKGVTQVAVGFVHVQRGNPQGAQALLGRAAAHLERYPSPHHGVDTDALRQAALAISAQVGQDGASPAAPFPPFPRA